MLGGWFRNHHNITYLGMDAYNSAISFASAFTLQRREIQRRDISASLTCLSQQSPDIDERANPAFIVVALHSMLNMVTTPVIKHESESTFEAHAQPKINDITVQYWHINPIVFYLLNTVLVALCCAFVYHIWCHTSRNRIVYHLGAFCSSCREDFENARALEMGLITSGTIDDHFGSTSSDGATSASQRAQTSPALSTTSELGISKYFHRNGDMRTLRDDPALKWELQLRERVEHGHGAGAFMDRLVDNSVGWALKKLGHRWHEGIRAHDSHRKPRTAQTLPKKHFVMGDVRDSSLAQRRQTRT